MKHTQKAIAAIRKHGLFCAKISVGPLNYTWDLCQPDGTSANSYTPDLNKGLAVLLFPFALTANLITLPVGCAGMLLVASSAIVSIPTCAVADSINTMRHNA